MSDRVYILLDILNGKAEQATEILRESPGVVMADALEGPPNVIIIMEAPERQQLARLTIQTLASVETITEHVCLLPTRDKLNTATFPKPPRRSRTSGKKGDSR
jgi:hypothetical protein